MLDNFDMDLQPHIKEIQTPNTHSQDLSSIKVKSI